MAGGGDGGGGGGSSSSGGGGLFGHVLYLLLEDKGAASKSSSRGGKSPVAQYSGQTPHVMPADEIHKTTFQIPVCHISISLSTPSTCTVPLMPRAE
jgi:hypothetical protein